MDPPNTLKMRRRAAGFTLIELLIIIAIIGVLASVLTPGLLRARDRANDQTTAAYLRNCMTAVEVNRSSTTAELPPALNGAPCNSPLLGNVTQTEPSAITPGSSKITISDGNVILEATSVTGNKFTYNGQAFTITPGAH